MGFVNPVSAIVAGCGLCALVGFFHTKNFPHERFFCAECVFPPEHVGML